jgi:hypothetical protein
MILRIRCLKRRVKDVHAFRLENGIKCLCELAVSGVNKEVKGCLAFRKLPHHLLGLLGYPTGVRISGDTRQMHLTCPKFDEEQNIQPLQPERIHGEEIAGQDLLL